MSPLEHLRTWMPSLSKPYTSVLGTPVALTAAQVVWPMDKAMVENLSSLANLVLRYGGTLVIAEGLDILAITAVALILVFLAARLVRRTHGGFLKSFRARRTIAHKRALGRLFNSQRSPVLKPCPNCAAQLPLTAILCDSCDYNFLAERPGRGQNLLSSPQPMTREVPQQRIAP
jgi:hypothetical protein